MSENILLLQGPIGPFFSRFAEDLEHAGHKVSKVNFNGGDSLFYNSKNTVSYHSTPDNWSNWIEEKLKSLSITRIYLFGDGRFYHKVARQIAEKQGIRVFVFEEGYIRPDYITLEEHGVNGNSQLSKNPEEYKALEATPPRRPHFISSVFRTAAFYSSMYYIASSIQRKKYPHYQHHRPLNVFGEGSKWIKSFSRKAKYKFTERNTLKRLQTTPYFLTVLQVHSDMQIKDHSKYSDVTEFIEETIQSFAENADDSTLLVLKHHPYDRAYRNYTSLINTLGSRLNVSNRLIYIHDIHLPSLLKKALGTITINSTVGLSSLHQNTPVKVMGDAIYNFSELSYQDTLDSFWLTPGVVNRPLFIQFRAYLLRHNQINGSFFVRLRGTSTVSGTRWPKALEPHIAKVSKPLITNTLSPNLQPVLKALPTSILISGNSK